MRSSPTIRRTTFGRGKKMTEETKGKVLLVGSFLLWGLFRLYDLYYDEIWRLYYGG